MDLRDKRILITGGSSGIGFAMARLLVAKGAKVAISGRRPDLVASAVAELKSATGFAWGVAADVGTAEGRAQTLDGALTELGGLDILVNNAASCLIGRKVLR